MWTQMNVCSGEWMSAGGGADVTGGLFVLLSVYEPVNLDVHFILIYFDPTSVRGA